MSLKVFRHLYHACWYIIATIVLVAAVSVTLIRIGLPHVNDYREDILTWVNKYSGYSIEAKSIDATWQGWTPYLNFYGITVKDSPGTNTLTTLQSATISFNPLSSLVMGGLSPLNITIRGPKLVIIRASDGSIHFAEDNSPGISGQQFKTSGFLAEWLLQQHRIFIENATIDYVDANLQDSPVKLTNVGLHFKKSSARMQIDVSANLPENFGQSLNLKLDAFGDITTPHWYGHIYAEGNNIYPAMFMPMSQDINPVFHFSSAPSNIKLWSHWKDGHLDRAEGTIDASNIELARNDSTLEIQHLESSFSGKRNPGKGYDISLDIADLTTANGVWPRTKISISKQKDNNNNNERYLARINYLKIDDVYSILMSLLNKDNNIVDNKLMLEGALNNNFIIYKPGARQPLYMESDIDYLSVKNNDMTVSSNGGHIEGNFEYGTINLNSSSLDISIPDYFDNNLSFYELSGDITWENNNDNLTLKSNYIETHTTDFNALMKGNVVFDKTEKLPVADLLVSVKNIDLEKIIKYTPKTVPKKVHDWIKTALVSGEVPRIDAVLRGPLEDFPFDHQEGQFKLIANIQNSILDYDDRWVPVDRLDADLEVDNKKLTVMANTGYIYNAEITTAEAVINDLREGESTLKINGHVKGNTEDALFIIDNSPLSASGMLKQIRDNNFNGPLSLDLELDVPFHHKPISFNGDLILDNVAFQSPTLNSSLQKVTGDILFTENSVKSNKLTAKYFDHNVDVGISSENGSNLVFSLEGDADRDFITEQLTNFFPSLGSISSNLGNHINGNCRWIARMSPVLSDTGEINTNDKLLTIESSLSGLSLELPAPLGKKDEPTHLEITSKISSSQEKQIGFVYGDNLTGNIILQKGEKPDLVSAEIAMGKNENLSGADNGIQVHGQIDTLSLSDWHDFLSAFNKDQKTTTSEEPVKMNLNVSALEFYYQVFENTNIKLTNINSDWQIDLRGNDIEGGINIPADIKQQPVKLYFSKLHLKNNEEISQNVDIDPRKLPSIDLSADKFVYDTYNLGKLTLNTTRTNDGLKVNSINFSKPDLTISGNGSWEYNNDQEFSNFTVQLNANKLDSMLSTFDYNVSPIKDGKTTLKMQAIWNGSPMEFSLANVNGDLSMDIEKGQVLEIEPAAGRLFGLLSLQTLPRRLSLDFSDLFKKGFSFDQITGTFTIEDGNAYTNNLSLTGPSANINITGRTGLVVKDYDQLVTVTPQVSSSLPVASALFGPIGVGVGAVIFLANELFKTIPKNIDKLLSYQYTISGSWDKPVVEKYGNETEPSG